MLAKVVPVKGWTSMLRAAIGSLVFFAGIATFSPANAQTEEERLVAFGREIFKSKATCQFCHRWDGNGDQGYGGNALSLRITKLDRDQLIEIVKCGRPSTGMPYHDRGAYSDKRCFDSTKTDLGEATPPGANGWLNPREIEAVVDYLLLKIKDRGETTYEECQEFWGTATRQCEPWKK